MMQEHVYVGVYLQLEVNKIEDSYITSGCTIHGSHNGRFCATCGKPKVEFEFKYLRRPNLFDLLPEDIASEERLTCNADGVGTAPDTMLIAWDNINDDYSGGNENALIEITPELIAQAIGSFTHEMAEEITHIGKSPAVTSVVVKFGVVRYWD